ncbi:MAG: hypothetical protein IPK37_16210 [Austwickia sp.]|nr:MAG: hypothetical protein IPK37_16210 [Austwickia sp.]
MSTDSVTSQFATVFRGFDPGQVEAALASVRESAAHAREECARVQAQLHSAQTERDDLRRRVADVQGRLESRAEDSAAERDELKQRLVEAQAKIEQYRADLEAESSFVHLGKRIGQILSLAEAEAASLITKATGEAAGIRDEASGEAERVRRSAEQYAAEVRERAETDVEQASIEAKENAATIVDDAVRDAAARREEAEAYFERQRAMAAEAAADFERTLGQRREKATREFQAEMAAQEDELRRVTERVNQMRLEGEQERANASSEAAQRLVEARDQAHEMVETARTQAERIRRESERELAAAMARRDSITSQLSNVRSMLATFGLGTGVGDDALAAIPGIAAFREQVEEAHRETEQVSFEARESIGQAAQYDEDDLVGVAEHQEVQFDDGDDVPAELTSGAHAEHDDDQLDQMLGEERESVH